MLVYFRFLFYSLQELEKMKEIAKLKQLPPVYTGKWSSATNEEVQEELAKGTPYTYRFRVPKEGSLKINDLIRGEVISAILPIHMCIYLSSEIFSSLSLNWSTVVSKWKVYAITYNLSIIRMREKVWDSAVNNVYLIWQFVGFWRISGTKTSILYQ